MSVIGKKNFDTVVWCCLALDGAAYSHLLMSNFSEEFISKTTPIFEVLQQNLIFYLGINLDLSNQSLISISNQIKEMFVITSNFNFTFLSLLLKIKLIQHVLL